MASSTFFMIAATFVVVQLLISSADAISCYTCSDCSETLGSKTACGNEYTQCAELQVQDLYKVTKSRYCAGQCPTYGSSTVSVKCCSTDYCNTASAQVGSIQSIVGALTLLVPAVVRFY